MPTSEMPMHFVNRVEWGAKPPLKELIPLKHPVPYVVLSYTTDVKSCHSNHKCTKRMRAQQEHDQNVSGMADMRANFYVTGDGYVYEGRGWRVEPEKIPDRPDLDGKIIEFTYVGDHSARPPKNEMLYRSWQAMEIGTELKFLTEDFEILNMGGPEYDNIGDDEPKF